MTDIVAPTVDIPPAGAGMTGRSLRQANSTITRMHDQAIALRRELKLKQEAIELLRDCLTEAEQELTILHEELRTARQAAE